MKKILFEPLVSVVRFDYKDIVTESNMDMGEDWTTGEQEGRAPGRAPLGSDMWTL